MSLIARIDLIVEVEDTGDIRHAFNNAFEEALQNMPIANTTPNPYKTIYGFDKPKPGTLPEFLQP